VLVLAIMGAGTVTATASPVDAVAPPQVSVPSVPVPEVSVPEVSVPQVSVPAVPVPAAPAPAPAPAIAVPAAQSVQVPAAVAPGSSTTRTVGPTVEAVADRVVASGGSLSLGPGAGEGERAAERRREAARHRRAVRVTILRLRRKVRRVDHCLHLLPRKSRRALRLHLGLGDARPRSRQAVARRMGTSWWRIRRMERRSLAQLRRADRAGVCGEAATDAGSAFAVAGTDSGGVALASFTTPPPATVPAVPQDQDQGQGQARGGVRGETDSGRAPRDGRRGGPIGLVDTAEEDLQTLALILVGLVAAGFLLGLLGRLRRTRGPAQ
jgi:hypothetical protein